MNIEFLYLNEINTTTMLSVTTGTATALNLFDRYSTKKYKSIGDNDDATVTTIHISFNETTTVNRIILQNHNFKDFTIFYNGATANTLSPALALTSVSDWSGNSATNHYLYLSTSVYMTSLTIEISATMITNEEKTLGELWLTRQNVQLDYMPDKKNYKPVINRKEYPHQMSDGGVALYILDENYKADIKLAFLSQTSRDNLYDLYNNWNEFIFIPFPTGTSWDSRIFQVNWVGKFDFEVYSDNYKDNGFEGTIRLMETPR